MKRINKCVLLLISGILSVSFVGICSAFENEPDNFRGIKWGTKLADLPDMVVQRTKGEEEICRRKNDKMQIGDAVLKSVEYAFYKDRFYAVFIEYEGNDNFSLLSGTLSHAYGKSDAESLRVIPMSYHWKGTTVNLWFTLDPSWPYKGEINYFYKPILEEISKDKKTQGVGDL